MARQVLENGVILPAEYSDDWYDDMTSNLTKLDDVIGSDSEKLSSSDVGAAALSNNYNDLDNLPTIPTVNDATLTIQKNGVDVQTFTANASSNVTCNITVPTKTSDLTNDSDFVDTSNSAVSSGITSAKVTDYDTHIADTDIHVTTADKTTWNNQTYVFRYSSTVLVASSTNSNALLDNTDNLKVGDKVIDSSGVLFSITAIDTQNSTFTIGTALIDLAQDSDVVHRSGDETVGGVKTFSDNPVIGNNNTNITISNRQITANGSYSAPTGSSYSFMQLKAIVNYADSSPSIDATVGLSIQENAYSDGKRAGFNPNSNNTINLGLAGKRWANVYATNYYYGSSEVEFSTKFVTTDTAQTITGAKTLANSFTVYNPDNATNTSNLILKNEKQDRLNPLSAYSAQYFYFLDKNNNALGFINCGITPSQVGQLVLRCYDKNGSNEGFSIRKSPTGTYIQPSTDNLINFGTSSAKWSDVQTYKVNALEPSSLSLPSGRNTRVDISSYFTNLGSGDTNAYNVPANGYIYMQLRDIATVHCFDFENSSTTVADYIQTFSRGNDGQLYVLFPVKKDHVFKSTWYTNTTVTITGAYFIPCQGNV